MKILKLYCHIVAILIFRSMVHMTTISVQGSRFMFTSCFWVIKSSSFGASHMPYTHAATFQRQKYTQPSNRCLVENTKLTQQLQNGELVVLRSGCFVCPGCTECSRLAAACSFLSLAFSSKSLFTSISSSFV